MFSLRRMAAWWVSVLLVAGLSLVVSSSASASCSKFGLSADATELCSPESAGTISTKFWDAAMHPDSPMVVDLAHEKHLKRRRESLLTNLAGAIQKDGKYLQHRHSNQQSLVQASFSKHGSLYHRLHLKQINDVDIYVALDGTGMTYQGHPLSGTCKAGETNPNIRAFAQSSGNPELKDSTAIEQWMMRMVEEAIPPNARHKVKVTGTPGHRGACVLHFGEKPKSSFDIIPAFLMKRGDTYYHVVPSNGQWETNPTSDVMDMVKEYHLRYPRKNAKKSLGFKDIVKMLKVMKKEFSWEEHHNVTSFTILHAARAVAATMFTKERTNQERVSMVIRKLNDWIAAGGITDPVYGERKLHLTGKPITCSDEQFIRLMAVLSAKGFAGRWVKSALGKDACVQVQLQLQKGKKRKAATKLQC